MVGNQQKMIIHGIIDNHGESIVTKNPEILGGTPVFTGIRVPIGVLFENLADGHDLKDILNGYPTLEREQAIEALRAAQSLLESQPAA
uniref:Uncharacterized conserved protein, DUF433 family n=1 Tax=Candidatus Kentrum sp. SD TaxID=2126332 RepID=A0A450Z3B4_9GAMM|nr:MAG: Uncharacterized conserved protein, DUF433 family [Candidatus Kentron sp. SD]VFK48274.1 MAG: Uncharacterized conserved protein, DUF433 family [Candidatus Kentron sp. SD]